MPLTDAVKPLLVLFLLIAVILTSHRHSDGSLALPSVLPRLDEIVLVRITASGRSVQIERSRETTSGYRSLGRSNANRGRRSLNRGRRGGGERCEIGGGSERRVW